MKRLSRLERTHIEIEERLVFVRKAELTYEEESTFEAESTYEEESAFEE